MTWMLAFLRSLSLAPTLSSPTRYSDALLLTSMDQCTCPTCPHICYLSHSAVVVCSVSTSDRGHLAAGLHLIFGSSSNTVEWVKFGWMGTWVQHLQGHQASLSPYSFFIHFSFIHLLIYEMASNSSKQENVDQCSTQEKQASVCSTSAVTWTINSSGSCAIQCDAEPHTNKTFWEADEVNGGKGVEVSKICSFIRVELDKTHTFFHMI